MGSRHAPGDAGTAREIAIPGLLGAGADVKRKIQLKISIKVLH
jgi:hypothetical protein